MNGMEAQGMAPDTGPLPLAAVPVLERALERAAGRAFKAMNRAHQEQRGERMWKLSMSGLGGCTREAAYKLAGVLPSDPELAYDTEARQAMLGTIIHERFLPVFGDALAHAEVEMPVELRVPVYADDGSVEREVVITGSTDCYTHVMGGGVIDLKTIGAYMLGGVEHEGVREEHRTQVRGYATAIRQWGMPVAWVAWLYMDRASGEVMVHVEPFTAEAEQATEDRVRWLWKLAATPDTAPRGHRGPGLSVECDGCAWLKECFGPDAEPGDSRSLQVHANEDIAYAARRYRELLDEIGPLEKDKEMYGAMIGRPKPGVYGDVTVTFGASSEKTDGKRAEELLREYGIDVPKTARRGNRNVRWARSGE
ncbi:hypothetical protein ACFPC0_10590 [Streptomyces andamanensis]|uniref:PD-(D/E)XK nuclease family protein n=1 Tax=Streptomyces andamanensis TaxID=1565035 RepID=A0ABV8TCD3_9ACTN